MFRAFVPAVPYLSRRHMLIGATALAASAAIPPAFGKGVDGFLDNQPVLH